MKPHKLLDFVLPVAAAFLLACAPVFSDQKKSVVPASVPEQDLTRTILKTVPSLPGLPPLPDQSTMLTGFVFDRLEGGSQYVLRCSSKVHSSVQVRDWYLSGISSANWKITNQTNHGFSAFSPKGSHFDIHFQPPMPGEMTRFCINYRMSSKE